MKLEIYKSLWGMEGSLDEQIRLISDGGYDGVESAIAEIADITLLKQLLKKYSLQYIPLIYTEGAAVADHITDFRRLVTLASETQPQKIVAHAGRDLWNFDDQCRFIEQALQIEKEIGIPVAHETHRRRPLYSPMNAARLFEQFPELKINADLSHWCCVTESMLEDHTPVIEEATKRTIHIHCRVGYENGPQVSDPRVAQWNLHREKFEHWWSSMIKEQQATGKVITATPEYGPPTYMQTTPATNEPVCNLWEICRWSAERFRKLAT